MSERDAVARRHQAFLASFASEDYPALKDLVTDDHVGMPPGRPKIIGRDGAEAFWREGFSIAESAFSSQNQNISVLGDVAIDRFDFVMTIKPRDGSSPLQDHGECWWLWRKGSDGEWRIASAIWNSDLAEPKLWSGG